MLQRKPRGSGCRIARPLSFGNFGWGGSAEAPDREPGPLSFPRSTRLGPAAFGRARALQEKSERNPRRAAGPSCCAPGSSGGPGGGSGSGGASGAPVAAATACGAGAWSRLGAAPSGAPDSAFAGAGSAASGLPGCGSPAAGAGGGGADCAGGSATPGGGGNTCAPPAGDGGAFTAAGPCCGTTGIVATTRGGAFRPWQCECLQA